MSAFGRARREARAALELWLLPFVVAALPYRIGIAFARWVASVAPIYAPAADDALRAYGAVAPDVDAQRWRSEYRFHQLIDHADLYWALTRSRTFLDRLLRGAPALPADDRPLIVLAFHYGQGLALMRWLTAAGRPPRFVSIRLRRDDAGSSVGYAYARLRNRMVERFTGMPLILTGGARREIARSLLERTTVLGLVDVPLADAGAHAANAQLLGHPVVLPLGLLESAIPGTRAIVVSARTDDDGFRVIEAVEDEASALTIARLADELSKRLAQAPAAWHFWHLWPRFLARTDAARPLQDGADADRSSESAAR